MNISLKNTIQFAGSCLNDKLVSAETIFQISQIANLLPPIPAISEAVLECHLGLSAPKTDFSVSFTPSNQGRESLAGFHEPLSSLCNNSVWGRVRDFCVCWADTKSPLYEKVDHIWLEFDLDGLPSEVSQPSFFFRPKGIKYKKNNSFLNNSIYSPLYWVTDEALMLLFGKVLPRQVKNNILTCFKSLPPAGEVYQIGVMLPRKSESQAVRLCVKGIAKKQILEYLKNIGWLDSTSYLTSVLSEVSELVDDIMLSFSVEKNVFPQIGFECYFEKQPPFNLSRWQSFIDYLAKNKLCTLEEGNALLDWTGCLTEKSNQEVWPSNFTKASAFVESHFKSTFFRLLNHIKIVYQPNQPLKAKAYLWFGHRWISVSDLFEKSSKSLIEKA